MKTFISTTEFSQDANNNKVKTRNIERWISWLTLNGMLILDIYMGIQTCLIIHDIILLYICFTKFDIFGNNKNLECLDFKNKQSGPTQQSLQQEK